ncbi:MAG: bifunctional riboflavin kinase/FAD synthetase [Verrucomicrobiota bacterium]|nr:bifunctional riboflavin kinase/FAD synthetase [Verrucomicrobiota bacterium]
MNIIHAANELNPDSRKICVAIGVFDGVHLGHQQVIRQMIAEARQHEAMAVVVTFDCHPNSVVAPERSPPLIYSLEKKLRVIGSLGADTTLLIHFDKSFSEISGEKFIRDLAEDFGRIHSVCVGSNFTFGYKRGGDVALLKKLGAELNFTVHGLAAVSLDGQPVSSTRVREAIRAGDFDAASQMLGRAYSLCGKIIEGDKLGRQLGFPTANLNVAGLILPPTGVYAIHATVSEKTYRAVLNIGFCPTLKNPTPQVQMEAHLLDFSENIYGREMEIIFVEKLREEQKFSSLEDLKLQIAKDIKTARTLF